MTRRDPEADPAAFLGAELRRARVAAGFSSQEVLAAKLGFDRSVVGKAETGDRAPTAEVLAAWCEACQLDGDLFARMAALARRADGPVPTWFAEWIDAEQRAMGLCCWEPLLVPGLVQTADYAQALFRAWRLADDGDDLDTLVSTRMERQTIFDRPEPPSLWVIIDETVLHRCIGSAKIMYDQLMHLTDVADKPKITIQVVPGDVGAHVGLLGAFATASVDGEGIVYLESPDQGQTTKASSVVAKVSATFDTLRAEALPRGASHDLIKKVAEQRWT
jgi:transcriptional regulator with XRE-family HTH domain